MSKRPKAKGRPRKSKPPTLPPMIGDHGTGTAAATHGTEVVLLDGPNPNRVGRRQRVSAIDRLERAGSLTMRQVQAAREIENAYCRCEALSSGGPLKAKVDGSPKPDAVVTSQVDAVSRLHRAMFAVPRDARAIVEWVCWHNQPVSSLVGASRHTSAARLKLALELVANHLRY